MKATLTIKDFIEKGSNKDVYIHARGKYCRVSHVRWPESDPWAVCPDGNGGFGLSYCVHYGTQLFTN